MRMPCNPRIGFWGNYGFQKPFKPLGRWVGEQLPNELVGYTFRQHLMEGVLEYRVNVLFDREKPRREQLETILMLMTRDVEIIEAMWQYETWERIVPNVEDEQGADCEGSSAPSAGGSVPW